MKHQSSIVGLLSLGLLLGGVACVSASKAKPYAANRSGCEGGKIEVVKQDGHDVVLDVCGTHEDWTWHAFNGWEYVGRSAEQPYVPPPDADGDGVPDPLDACPTRPGVTAADVSKNGCPPPADTDGDGVVDPLDACATVPGVLDADPKKSGCPADRDSDGVPDAQDACPDLAGVQQQADAQRHGCPPDQDADGVADAQDACPDVAGVADADASKNGCPAEAADEDDSAGDADPPAEP